MRSGLVVAHAQPIDQELKARNDYRRVHVVGARVVLQTREQKVHNVRCELGRVDPLSLRAQEAKIREQLQRKKRKKNEEERKRKSVQHGRLRQSKGRKGHARWRGCNIYTDAFDESTHRIGPVDLGCVRPIQLRKRRPTATNEEERVRRGAQFECTCKEARTPFSDGLGLGLLDVRRSAN
jgi:hypothetical protein